MAQSQINHAPRSSVCSSFILRTPSPSRDSASLRVIIMFVWSPTQQRFVPSVASLPPPPTPPFLSVLPPFSLFYLNSHCALPLPQISFLFFLSLFASTTIATVTLAPLFPPTCSRTPSSYFSFTVLYPRWTRQRLTPLSALNNGHRSSS